MNKEKHIERLVLNGWSEEQAADHFERTVRFNKKLELIDSIVGYSKEDLWYLIKIMEQRETDLEDAIGHLQEIKQGINEDCWNLGAMKEEHKQALKKLN